MKKSKFSFLIVCSKKYIHETVGLVRNINQLYPNYKIFIISLDVITKKKLLKLLKKNVSVLTVEKIWGDIFYKNLECRMSVPEIAYATKSAAAYYLIKKYTDSLLILDADLLILEKIDDVIRSVKKADVTLISANRDLIDWRRSNDIGLFSAGIIGFSKKSLEGILWWKSQCFNHTNINIFYGNYYEQKFLDYFVLNYNTKLIKDIGINLSSTFLRKAKPFYDKKKKKWLTIDKVPIRIFHQSRVTNHKIYELKNLYLQDFNLRINSSEIKQQKIIIRIDGIINYLRKILGNFIFLFIYLKRIFLQKKYNYLHAFIETFIRKKKLFNLIKEKNND